MSTFSDVTLKKAIWLPWYWPPRVKSMTKQSKLPQSANILFLGTGQRRLSCIVETCSLVNIHNLTLHSIYCSGKTAVISKFPLHQPGRVSLPLSLLSAFPNQDFQCILFIIYCRTRYTWNRLLYFFRNKKPPKVINFFWE